MGVIANNQVYFSNQIFELNGQRFVWDGVRVIELGKALPPGVYIASSVPDLPHDQLKVAKEWLQNEYRFKRTLKEWLKCQEFKLERLVVVKNCQEQILVGRVGKITGEASKYLQVKMKKYVYTYLYKDIDPTDETAKWLPTNEYTTDYRYFVPSQLEVVNPTEYFNGDSWCPSCQRDFFPNQLGLHFIKYIDRYGNPLTIIPHPICGICHDEYAEHPHMIITQTVQGIKIYDPSFEKPIVEQSTP